MKKYIKRLFRYEASLVLKKYKPKIIVIIGSVGKTSTKEMVYSALSQKYFIRKNEKSFTASLGIPLVIIGGVFGRGSLFDWLKNLFRGFILIIKKVKYPEYLILEVDNDKPGDLKTVSEMLSPDLVVMTSIGDMPTHVEVFGSKEKVLKEYDDYLKSLKPECKIIYNKDGEVVRSLIENKDFEKISITIDGEGNINADNRKFLYGKNDGMNILTGVSYDIGRGDEKQNIIIFDSIGIHSKYATLLACGVGIFLGIPFLKSVSLLSKYKVLPGRMKIISGIKNTTIIDDSYNSSPVAMNESLNTFSRLDISGKKIVVIGDMLELGKYSGEEHKKLAHKIKDIADVVIFVGIRTRLTGEELLNLEYPKENIFYFDDSENAGKFLQNYIQKGDCILVKGSQAMRMEKTVEEIMRHPEDKKTLLVRQEQEWRRR
ncbi:MAG: UDP-N-acetylmuramoyl-tripeptide--D-alanyl-D-alanine ligase [Candidatus Paceibacterota bacterium]